MLTIKGGSQRALLLGPVLALTVIVGATLQKTIVFAASNSGISTASIAAVNSTNIALENQDYTAALRCFNQAINVNADSGEAYLSQGSSSAALTEFNLAVQDEPTNPDVSIARDVYWAKIEDTSRAQDDFQTALQLDPNSARAYNALGVMFAQQGNYQAAIDFYSKALAIDSYYIENGTL